MKKIVKEMKKISHPDKKTLFKDTSFVLITCVITSGIISLIDLGLTELISLLV